MLARPIFSAGLSSCGPSKPVAIPEKIKPVCLARAGLTTVPVVPLEGAPDQLPNI